MTVRLNREVLYRGRMYKAGEPISASQEMAELWGRNGLTVPQGGQNTESEPSEPPQTEKISAPSPPGMVEGGSGAEGEMPGRDSRKKRSK